MPSTAVRISRAEQVLLAILDAEPVDVDQIKAALAELAENPGNTANERLKQAAADVVKENDLLNLALAGDAGPDVPNFDRVWDAIDALRPILLEMDQ
jgi:hypothetical protein